MVTVMKIPEHPVTEFSVAKVRISISIPQLKNTFTVEHAIGLHDVDELITPLHNPEHEHDPVMRQLAMQMRNEKYQKRKYLIDMISSQIAHQLMEGIIKCESREFG